MSRFARIVEDPEYDIEVDEDYEWEDIEVPEEAYSPYETVNS